MRRKVGLRFPHLVYCEALVSQPGDDAPVVSRPSRLREKTAKSSITYPKYTPPDVASCRAAVVIVGGGLSDHEGKATLYMQQAHTGASSIYKDIFTKFDRPIDRVEQVNLTTLDIFCVKEGIRHIDLLKLDVEGHELKVLEGATNMLPNIAFIQFEMGKTNIGSRTYFKDFYDLLSPNFRLYRVLKNGLQPIVSYIETDEVFLTTNYLAESMKGIVLSSPRSKNGWLSYASRLARLPKAAGRRIPGERCQRLRAGGLPLPSASVGQPSGKSA